MSGGMGGYGGGSNLGQFLGGLGGYGGGYSRGMSGFGGGFGNPMSFAKPGFLPQGPMTGGNMRPPMFRNSKDGSGGFGGPRDQSGGYGGQGGFGGFGNMSLTQGGPGGLGTASEQGGNDQFGNVMGSQPWHYGGGYGGGQGGFGGGMGGDQMAYHQGGGYGGGGPRGGQGGGMGGGQGAGGFSAQVVLPGAIGGDANNPIYAGTPEGDAFMARAARSFGGGGPRGPRGPYRGPMGGFGGIASSIPGMSTPFTQPRDISLPPVSGPGPTPQPPEAPNSNAPQMSEPMPPPTSQPAPQFSAPAEPESDMKGGMQPRQLPFAPNGAIGQPGQYAAPTPGGDRPNPIPTPWSQRSPQAAYDATVAGYNSPDYAAYYYSLAPSTRAFMQAPGNPQTAEFLGSRARDTFNGGRNPWGP